VEPVFAGGTDADTAKVLERAIGTPVAGVLVVALLIALPDLDDRAVHGLAIDIHQQGEKDPLVRPEPAFESDQRVAW
jgi:hypothetical protein